MCPEATPRVMVRTRDVGHEKWGEGRGIEGISALRETCPRCSGRGGRQKLAVSLFLDGCKESGGTAKFGREKDILLQPTAHFGGGGGGALQVPGAPVVGSFLRWRE